MADWQRKQLNYDKADEKIKEWIAKGDTSEPLNLSKLDLISGHNEYPNVVIELPKNLKYLICNNNPGLKRFPKLPKGLVELEATNNNLITIPELPDSLKLLYINHNNIKSLPKLPSKLEELICINNKLVRLPELPNSLIYLECKNNVLSELPELPSGLEILICDENMLKTLPTLTKVNLIAISCSKNEITSLPELPNTLQELYCEYNKLKTLPKLPKSLVDLQCTYNNLTSVYQEICENISDDLAAGDEDNRELVLNRINKLMNNHPKHQSELKKYIDSGKISKFIEDERGTNTNRGILEYLNSNNLKNFNTNSLKPSNVQRKVLKNRGYTRKNDPTKPGRYRLKKL
jgi:hypothetical protein